MCVRETFATTTATADLGKILLDLEFQNSLLSVDPNSLLMLYPLHSKMTNTVWLCEYVYNEQTLKIRLL